MSEALIRVEWAARAILALFKSSALIFRPRKIMTDALNQVDICFVVDTTGSMGTFIAAAQQQLLDVMEALGAESEIDLQVGLVEFRDHPPQETSFVTRLQPLTEDFKRMKKVIDRLRADGGGDEPEAVYDGVYEAVCLMDWRARSYRLLLLVGDSPPHGYTLPAETNEAQGAPSARAGGRDRSRRPYGYTDTWPLGCPCGLDLMQVTAAAEAERVVVHALAMRDAPQTVRSFTDLAAGTGGRCVLAGNAAAVIDQIRATLGAEFRNLVFDREVLEAARHLGSLDPGAIADALESPRLKVASAIARLGRRGFFERDEKPYVLVT